MPVMFSFRKPAHNSWPPLPPKKETDEQRRTRIKKDTDARRKSDSIDRQLRLEREEKERHPSGAKILLLGKIYVDILTLTFLNNPNHRSSRVRKINCFKKLSTALCAESFRTRCKHVLLCSSDFFFA